MTKWNLIECATASIVQVDGNDVIFTYDEEPERWKRIARQFYATPDLLEACEAMYALFEAVKAYEDPDTNTTFQQVECLRKEAERLTYAAIAKAKGESND